ncbi:hypothetical protein LTR48_007152 [Friedmanniomyces endolithicus]|uniref:Uncharacterized protein n=1 Tax=Rachicladosporium monterosium TaxID=1507873 RepID=A0ABR0KWY1_9PEZI|nr:hypothetical protein LTR29_003590 [Friedmanniomyces endolithicus]KAK1082118.1 hypothetical protein LTR48_007152 [Friedmanniomyces endolithicus]KAK5139905.1 hypothetical protein LTR32_007132 [Rachicladosporium monterosium]
MAQVSTKQRKAQISYDPNLPDLHPSPTPYYSRPSTKVPKGDSTKPVVVVVVHQPSGPVREAGTERPGYGGYYH